MQILFVIITILQLLYCLSQQKLNVKSKLWVFDNNKQKFHINETWLLLKARSSCRKLCLKSQLIQN